MVSITDERYTTMVCLTPAMHDMLVTSVAKSPSHAVYTAIIEHAKTARNASFNEYYMITPGNEYKVK